MPVVYASTIGCRLDDFRSARIYVRTRETAIGARRRGMLRPAAPVSFSASQLDQRISAIIQRNVRYFISFYHSPTRHVSRG